jgi:hypothetical protein
VKQVSKLIRSIFGELCVLFIYVFLINNYIGTVDQTIKSDGQGYYDYLPSIFIHRDLVRKDVGVQNDTLRFSRIKSLSVYIDYDAHKVNKYPCGTAFLQLPFFIYTYFTTIDNGDDQDGYQSPYQKTIFHATLFYLFLSIFFLKKILNLYQIEQWVIFISQLLLVLATNVTHYANMEASFSHIYSLFAITAFFYFTKSYFLSIKLNYFLLSCLFLGLILLIRQINIISVLFIPFLAGSYSDLKKGAIYLFHNPGKLLTGMFLISSVFVIQCMCWYLQTGYFLLYSYQGEGFNFSNPELFSILFSYRKGLFVYTPVLLICMSGVLWMLYTKKYYLVFTWAFFFGILTYILSSWWCWYYGASYGLRAFIDFYSVFFICFAIMLNELRMRIIVVAISLLMIPVNIIQTYQYKEFILSWTHMTKEKYWKVFLKTDEKYKGLLWKKTINNQDYTIIKEATVGDFTTIKNKDQIIYKIKVSEINEFEKVNVIQILIDNEFNERNNTEIFLTIDKPKDSTPYHKHLIQFSGNSFNTMQTGIFDFELLPSKKSNNTITVEATTFDETTTLRNIKIRFLVKK